MFLEIKFDISSYPERWRDKGPVKPGNLLIVTSNNI